ncbi:PAS/PAC sensor signal transduction histidine kinase [[Leptolyngbya] sp. PCC 7376]|uniref:PAS domain-containing sensor histidine kinase n=1 Tax=[Leptolyngbya] sp. PCC 7376 TaxID=111781 RepID=UPI00029EE5DA|nr:PAS domain S-box protein [[Leptolyngbya] sp. PCC 7376]AFY40511.1 PAS/PAC sensor signal transduction histidine kinase [[Leptolyngbya] sp. PCC 7376]
MTSFANQAISQHLNDYIIDDGLSICNLETGQIINVDPIQCKMTGYSEAELTSQQLFEFIHPDSLNLFDSFLDTLRADKEFYCQAIAQRKDGSCFDIEVRAVACLYDGKPHGLITMQDISQRKAAEVALAESEAYHRNLLEQSSMGLLLCRMNGEFVYANQAFAGILGRENEDLSVLSYWEITPEKYAPQEQIQLQSLSKTGRYGPYEKEYIHKNGSLIPVRLSGRIVERHGEKFIWSSVENISDRKAAEAIILQKSQELEKALTQLQTTQLQMVQREKMATLGNLVAGVGHEINNPMGFLNGSINNAKDYIQELFEYLAIYHSQHPPNNKVQDVADDIDLEFILEDLPRLLESMTTATTQIKSISRSLRIFSRAETKEKVSIDLHDGLNSTLLILKYRLKATECRPAIEVKKDYGELPEIKCFSSQLNQVFMNILANAIDALEEASEGHSFEDLEDNPQHITIRTSVDNQHIKISIADNGLGIPKKDQARIFNNLFTTKAIGKGTGLGLAIARQIIVETHEGSIDVISDIDQGCEFCIYLPIT